MGKSTLVNCITNRGLFASDIATVKTTQLHMQEHERIIYVDTPGLFDSKMQKVAAKEITKALKQNGRFQVYFVVSMKSGKIPLIDLSTMWLVLNNALDIKFFGIIINKLSKEDYACLSQMFFELHDELQGCARFFLIQYEEQLYNHSGIFNCKQLEEFLDHVPTVDIDADKVKEMQDDDISFQRFEQMLQIYQLSSLTVNKHKCLSITDHLKRALGLAVSYIYLLINLYLFAVSRILLF